MEDAIAYADSVGATTWLLVAASLVLLMTPGLALFYGGMSRSKSVLNMMMMSFGTMGIIGVVWAVLGNGISVGESILGGFMGDPFSDVFLAESFASMDPETVVSAGFGATFCIITVALISGAIADRAKFTAWMVFAAIWGLLVYSPVSHWVWGGGLLNEDFALFGDVAAQDFAGGTVVHINAGVAALVLALLLGVRKGFGKTPFKPHNLPFVMLGAALLWFGWFGFNAGSAFAADVYATIAWVNTTVATAAAILGWLLLERLRDGKPTSLGAASGIVAGLVAITPAAASVDPLGATIIGFLAGVLSALAVGLKYKWNYDDSLDVVGVHLVAGLWGTLAIGLVGTAEVGAWDGLFYGGGLEGLWAQFIAAFVVIVYCAIATLIIGAAIKYTIGFRVSEEVEIEGIDFAEHGETAYEEAV